MGTDRAGAPRRVGVLGTFVWDTIRPAPGAGGPREQWGGMTYSLAAFSAALPPGWVAEPIVKVGADLAAGARALLATLPGVVPGPAVLEVPEPNPRVELRYRDAARRDERLSGRPPAWAAAELLPLLPRFDALYLNFLTGLELPLDDARQLRAAFPGPIYADLHSLFLGPPGAGPRQPRRLADWEEWLGCFDVVQMNEDELRLQAGAEEPEAFLARPAARGPRLALVTLGERGALAAAAVPGAAPLVRRIPLPDGPLPGDPTGCGDVWGGVVCCGLLAGLGLEEAVLRAHRLAGRKLRCPSTAGLRAALARPAPDAGG